MKHIVLAGLTVALLLSCARKEDFQIELIEDGLIDVSFTAGADDAESKVWTGWNGGTNYMFWSKSDYIGLFAGSTNVNRKFVLSSSENSTSGTFSGSMEPVSTPTTLVVYYPYSERASLGAIPFPDLSEQVFEGTFEEQGEFRTFGKYTLLVGGLNNFTIEKEWPSLSNVNFSPFTGLIRYQINNGLASSLVVRSVGISSQVNSLIVPSAFNAYTGQFKAYYTQRISTAISEKNPLVVNSSDTKYVQMATFTSNFQNIGQELTIYLETIDDDGRNHRYLILKNVNDSHNFQMGKRTSISVPVTDATPRISAYRVKVTISGTSLSAPVFNHGSGYEAADSWWGDSTTEKYEAGKSHTFTTPGVHIASFNHWGESAFVYFEKISGISAIDFSDVY